MQWCMTVRASSNTKGDKPGRVAAADTFDEVAEIVEDHRHPDDALVEPIPALQID